MEITTNMQHSNIKDRKRRAVKRAPKVETNTRAAKPKAFIRRNLLIRRKTWRRRWQISSQEKENQDLKICISAVRTKPLGGFVSQVMLKYTGLWEQEGLEEHSLIQSGLCVPKSSSFGLVLRSKPCTTEPRSVSLTEDAKETTYFYFVG